MADPEAEAMELREQLAAMQAAAAKHAADKESAAEKLKKLREEKEKIVEDAKKLDAYLAKTGIMRHEFTDRHRTIQASILRRANTPLHVTLLFVRH